MLLARIAKELFSQELQSFDNLQLELAYQSIISNNSPGVRLPTITKVLRRIMEKAVIVV